ncbi:MAG: glutamate--cysteine ligase [Lautropia sp.]|nr:MAG: glutamate--cysteine ligase [Pseudomonadota bacterium]MBC6958140.1 glutamate--cysteine ligase [Lautropia sp.]MCL4700282.1 glutamate--cysteine ligase [Burkholderiaceae bacterium]MDL1906831.1 glutamate--cysteine ligase [Betaproteobacteria bacterium PRO1]MEB2336526.1 glutamate--cysteine ligase [Burkholderiales bacterium]
MLTDRLHRLPPDVLGRLARGIEKESLRAHGDGTLADTPHPRGLGSALTHPHITTDFSESQLELITGVHADARSCLAELTAIHQEVHRQIGTDILWAASMPCGLPPDDAIPLARYGTSNVGRAKTVYRQGLSHRYGRRMQTISGIHYNFSVPEAAWPILQRADGDTRAEQDYRTAAYFGLIRNFRRRSWLLLYLFGASPAACSSFLAGHPHGLQSLEGGTLHLPYATSLRMGPLGYQSDVQSSLAVSFNCLESYSKSLSRALSEPYPAYERIGIHDGNGLYRQLATTLLQIENEFYGTIRPKRTIRPGERPLRALAERGVEYVEVRCLDLDPFSPIGIEAATLDFLDVFLLHCLLDESPPDTPDEIAAMSRNQHKVAQFGREPGLRLQRGNEEVGLVEWGRALLRECVPVADALDAATNGAARAAAAGKSAGAGAAAGATPHRDALAAAEALLADPALTPSARSLREMAQRFDNSFSRFALAQSLRHHETLLALPFSSETQARFARMAEESLAAQRRIEAADDMPFESWRQRYLAGELPLRDAR